MNRNLVLRAGMALACCLAWGAASPARAAVQPSSDLLLPYFEVDTRSSGQTTLFALGNHSEKPVEVLVSIHTNWGIPVLDLSLHLDAQQIRTVNLRDWLLTGDLPGRKLGAEEVSHLQAVLSGRASPRDQRYFSTEVEPGLAVGSITFRVQGLRRSEVLWGDFFLIDPAEDHLQAEALVSLGRPSPSECIRHSLRFLAEGDFDSGTELVIWSGLRVQPSSSPEFPDAFRLTADVQVYNEAGRGIGHRRMSLLPVQKVDVAALALSEPFGWLDIVTEGMSVVTTRYGMGGHSGVSVETFCLPESLQVGPALRIEQFVNGEEAAVPPGPLVPVGSPLRFDYTVTNAGSVPLDSILVTNNLGLPVECPESSLGPGSTMNCAASGIAQICAHEATATASGMPPAGSPVLAQDTSFYNGDEEAAIDVELLVDGEDADKPPGPYLVRYYYRFYESMAHWVFQVTNTGKAPLSEVTVTSQQELGLDCPSVSLAPGESRLCSVSAHIVSGPNTNLGTGTGTTPCGAIVRDQDPAHYVGDPLDLSLSLEILINGMNISEPPGPEFQTGTVLLFSYVVLNTGNAGLNEISITPPLPFGLTCPRSSLAPGEMMVCTGKTQAAIGQQQVKATVNGVYLRMFPFPWYTLGTSATDTSYYFGLWSPPMP